MLYDDDDDLADSPSDFRMYEKNSASMRREKLQKSLEKKGLQKKEVDSSKSMQELKLQVLQAQVTNTKDKEKQVKLEIKKVDGAGTKTRDESQKNMQESAQQKVSTDTEVQKNILGTKADELLHENEIHDEQR